jgi:hypothetical protein
VDVDVELIETLLVRRLLRAAGFRADRHLLPIRGDDEVLVRMNINVVARNGPVGECR